MPRQVDPLERRHTIVDAAYGILAEAGLEALSMRSVAKATGFTTGMVTHWFPSRGELLLAAIEIAAERGGKRARQAIDEGGGDVREALCAFLPLDTERSSDMRIWLGFWAASIGDVALADAHRRRYRVWAQQLVSSGAVADVHTAARLIAAVDGIALNAVLDPERWSQREQLAALDAAISTTTMVQDRATIPRA